MLTVPHVYQLLLKIGTGSSWKDALLEVLPKKKLNEGIKTEDKIDESKSEDDPEDTPEENTRGKSENKLEESPEES